MQVGGLGMRRACSGDAFSVEGVESKMQQQPWSSAQHCGGGSTQRAIGIYVRSLSYLSHEGICSALAHAQTASDLGEVNEASKHEQ